MKHYRIRKVAKPGGATIKTKDILATEDVAAVERARQDEDCPICEVYHAGKQIGSID